MRFSLSLRLLAILLAYASFLSAQEIPYTKTALDLNQTPAASRVVRQVLETDGGSYFNFNDRSFVSQETSTISFFDGTDLRELYSSPNLTDIIGLTDAGVFLRGENYDPETGRDVIQLFHLNVAANRLDTLLADRSLNFITHLARGSTLYVNEPDLGLFAVGTDGTSVMLEPPGDEFDFFGPEISNGQPFADRAIYTRDETTFVTDGTVAGTELFYEGVFGDFEYLDDQLIQFGTPTGLSAYNATTDVWTPLTEQYPGFRVAASVRLFRDGKIYLIASSNDTGTELFVTDGTVAGTRVAFDFAAGSASGFQNQSSYPAQLVGDRLFLRGGIPATEDNIYVTDGTPEGTLLVYREPTGLDNVGGFGAVRFPGTGTVLLTLREFGSNGNNWRGRLIRSQPAATNPTVDILLQDISFSSNSLEPKGFINDRLIIAWPGNFGYDIISYGPGGNADSLHLGRTGNQIFPEFSTPGRRYFWSTDVSGDFRTLYATDGLDQPLTPVLNYLRSSFANNGEALATFTQDSGNFAFAFDEVAGTNIYRIGDAGDASVVVPLEYSEGTNVSWFDGAEGALLLHLSTPEEDEGIYVSDGSVAGTNLILPGYTPNQSGRVLGAHEGVTYVYTRGNVGDEVVATELTPATTRILPSLDQLRPPSTNVETRYGTPALVDGTLYFLRSVRAQTGSGQPGELELLAYDLSTEQVRRPFRGTWTNIGFYGGSRELTVLDGRLYFTVTEDREDGSGTSYAYDPAVGTAVPLTPDGSPVETTPSILFSRERAYVATLRGNDYVMNRTPPVLPGGITVPAAPEAVVDLPGTTLVQLADGQVLATDFTSGSSLSLLEGTVASTQVQGLHLTPDGTGAVFFHRTDSRGFEVYRTDGTQAGTEPIGTVTAPYSTEVNTEFNVTSTVTFGNLVAVMFNGGTLLLVDPTDGRLQPVPVYVSSSSNSEAMRVVGNRLYFNDYSLETGPEIFYLTAGEQNLLRGTAYLDENGNGTREADEQGLGGVRIRNGRGGRGFSNGEGAFVLPAVTGADYTLTATPPNCFVPTGTQQYVLTYDPDSTYALSFGFRPEGGDAGVRIDTDAAVLRCGFTVPVWITVTNTGCEDLSGEFFVRIPAGGAYASSDSIPTSVTADSVGFVLGELPVGDAVTYRLLITMPDETRAGQPVTVSSSVVATDGSGAVLRGEDVLSEVLRCAIDPNDKQVSPSRVEPSGSNYTQLDETLKYRIRFQNTGNDTAFTVRIEDQLSADLDWTTFKPLTASHPFTASLSEAGLAVFLFENILLPDSTTNQTGSNGFVTFEIRANPGLEDFSEVANTAGIFFDFNQPVITNTIRSTFVEQLDADSDGFLFYEDCDDTDPDISPVAEEIPGNAVDENCDGSLEPVSTYPTLSGRLAVFPNPTDGPLELTYDGGRELLGALYDATGRQLRDFRFRDTIRLDLAGLTPGAYLLRLREADGTGQDLRWVVVR